MHHHWPQPRTLSIPDLDADAITIRAGIVADHSQWSSTAVSGSVSGSVYNGNGGVSGSISSTVTDHQRVFIHFPDDGTEMALSCDDWNLDVRPGHCLIVAFGGQSGTNPKDAMVAFNAHTRLANPGDDLKAGRLAQNFASRDSGALWFWRLIAWALALPGFAFTAWLATLDEDGWVIAILALLPTVAILNFITLPIARCAKRAWLRRLGREVRAALSPALEQVAAEIPRPAPAMASA